jgi:hypothetical protein
MSADKHQDWAPVTIHGKSGGGSSGHPGSARPHQNSEAARLRKLEESEAPQRPKTLTPESVATIQTYRREHNNMTQKEFDRLFSWPANTTNLLESRRAAPTPGQLRALNAQLKTGLTLG